LITLADVDADSPTLRQFRIAALSLELTLDSCIRIPHTIKMGWFSSDSANAPAAPKATGDGGFIAPDRTKRAHCWEARDAYFGCLDKNNIIDSVKRGEEADKLCPDETVKFDQNCATSWVRSCSSTSSSSAIA
jgi:cytochrome c oxidase assembly factor 6